MEVSVENGPHRQKINLKGGVQMFKGNEDSIIARSIDKEFDESILNNSK